jgi:hypothetical protein
MAMETRLTLVITTIQCLFTALVTSLVVSLILAGIVLLLGGQARSAATTEYTVAADLE